MALTTKQETTLKEMAAERDKEKAIASINQEADVLISTKRSEIIVIEDKRQADIKDL